MGVDVRTWLQEKLLEAVVIEHRSTVASAPEIAALADMLHGQDCYALAGFARVH
jgi:hypothetical protein